MAELIPMTRYSHLLETRTGLRMMIFGAGVLALLLACAGTAAGATWVVDDDGGADHMGMRTVEAAG